MTGSFVPDPFAHAAESLGLDGALALVASYCHGELARNRILSLRPFDDEHSISESLREIEEYRELGGKSGKLPVADVSHGEELERTVASNGVADPVLLLHIAAAERAAADIFKTLADARQWPRLQVIGGALNPNKTLVDAVERAIDSDGAIKDSASSALRSIRRSIVSSKTSLRRKSERVAAEFGEGTLNTMLGDRHVLVVPRSKVQRKNGLVHSASQTGESLYFEPASLVEANNVLESLHGDESAEIARILRELSDIVHAGAHALIANIKLLVELETIRAKASFAEAHLCSTPATSDSGRIELVGARHPVLEKILSSSSPDRALVPLDVILDPAERLMVITGPNAGGKTVALKTVGLCVLLFQCGLQIPCAEGSELPIFDRVLVDIGDEQSIEDSLSTFTSHLRHLDAMTRLADDRTLCLVDEIGGGTDPDEGAALAISSLETLIASKAAVIATTHYGRIKAFALRESGVVNASMAFEDTEGRPLYRLLLGVAGRSRGLETARRTGFNPEVVERAETYIGKDAFALESVLSELEHRILDLEREREALTAQREAAARAKSDYEARSSEFNMSKKEANRRALREANEILVRTRAEVERVVQTIRERDADKEAIREGRKKIGEMLDSVTRELHDAQPEKSRLLGTVSIGDLVSLNEAGTPRGSVIAVENKNVTVEMAGKRIKIPMGKLYAASKASDAPSPSVTHDASFEPLTSTSLDMRGQEREEALAGLTRFVDRAVLSGVEEVLIIHGIGGGILARAVREFLKDDTRVASMRQGEPVEGGAGVTIARFVS